MLDLAYSALQSLLMAVCLWFETPIAISSIDQYTNSVLEVIPFLKRQDRQLPFGGQVDGVFNPFAAKKLESLTPPRPPVESLSKQETWSTLQTLCDGVVSAVQLACSRDWFTIDVRALPFVTERNSDTCKSASLPHDGRQRYTSLAVYPFLTPGEGRELGNGFRAR